MVDKVYPMPETYGEFQEGSNIMEVMKSLAKDWLSKWEFKHEWIIPSDPKKMKQAIKSALPFGPVALAVTAWMQGKDGLYIDNGQANTHWCVCYGYIEDERGLILKIFDSYDHSTKLLSPDHNVQFAKRILITKKTTEPKPKQRWWFVEIIYQIWKMLFNK
jgi:hypothetical protein